jgi:DNA modification methylase
MILHGDAIEQLKDMPDESVHCCVTSPPYWGLRDYGDGGQLGLETTPEEYVENIVAVFREVRRVLRDDGTLWLNLGDTYASGLAPGLKQKDLVGIPWRVAFALQADGWWLRSDIIWNKPNPMPESTQDRPTCAHEHIFLLSRSKTYYYDAYAIREPAVEQRSGNHERLIAVAGERQRTNTHLGSSVPWRDNGTGRNKRNVWTVTAKPYPDAHFAVFPADLIEPCVLAGTSQKGACVECGAPYRRVFERKEYGDWKADRKTNLSVGNSQDAGLRNKEFKQYIAPEFVGWEPGCECESNPIPCWVLDPFCGAGTTGVVSSSLGRNFIGIEIKEEYVDLAANRIAASRIPEHAGQTCTTTDPLQQSLL